MPDAFHSHIRSALANPGLQSALDGNAERRLQARLQGYTSLPEELQVLRRRAHDVRAETIANLDHYLDQFISRAEANGLVIHRAADAAQAVAIVLEIARQQAAGLVAKAKTMVGEEIGINHALETAGLRVVETDLGEYIVQLRGERPAHILTPAVHLRRSEVAQTFHEKLGIPRTEDIPTLVAAARQVLRQSFLEAEIGISGVNFGIAESGTLCMITNEGNGRMVTTLPPVHIALLGIERLLPTLDDLALMLSLLPRSGTGQKLTVYTALINSARRPGEVDGALQRHVILVDNGRSAIRRSSLAESLLCIRCGACLNACPVFREIGGHAYLSPSGASTPYPGPIGSVLSPGLFGQSEFGGLARASSLCGACKEACPVDIDLPKLLLRVRAGGVNLSETQAAPAALDRSGASTPSHVPLYLNWGLRVFTWAAASPRRFALAQRLAGGFSRLLAPFSPWLRLPAFTGWGFSRDFPRPAMRPFRARWEAKKPEAPVIGGSGKQEIRQSGDPAPSGIAQPEIAQTLAARFAAELAAIGGRYTAVYEHELVEHILGLLRERGIDSLQAWEQAFLPSGLLDGLRTAGIKVSHDPDPSLKAGLTGALAGVADTGSLLLTGGPGCPQTASLLPEIHLAVLRAGDIYANLPQVLQLREVREAGVTTLVSGPSRTADIELTLTIGVHGPGEVHVFCIHESEA